MAVVLAAASAEVAKWSTTALLAGVTGLLVGGLALLTSYSGEAGPGEGRRVLRTHLGRLLSLLALEAAAGIATAGLVVLLGVSEPAWIDEPAGWLLVGLAGPAVGAATIAEFSLGSANLRVGPALVYTPLRQWLIEPLDNGFRKAGNRFEQRAEAIYRQRAEAAYEAGNLTLEKLTTELRNYAGRDARTKADKDEIESQLSTVRPTRQNVAPGEQAVVEKAEIDRLIAFVIANRHISAIEVLLGELTRDDLEAIEPQAPVGAIV